ncbi:unnamed protein product [Didymodactylos carnosus]|uniref:Proteasome beta subunit C-terminal domain-containing protein n=1 Tax=Didymodactylos carnosus TaxID=1234261 RepID=A0A814XR18_9BILA|nr:unnamed protein product [Didymodactylos carnosus]CAF1219257.1 unnamed protein product [Didymodactylos carnosus]CAF3765365.1 unnamed protein product [Didymodactylos carnosus]CAF3982727.1 unnamed protein product [Didymodactylos carnosus]
MAGVALEIPSSGFTFDNCRRNEVLLSNGVLPGKVRKTGTTIAAMKFKVCEGNIIFDDNVALGAGTSADCDFQTRMLESQLELLKLNTDRQVRVAAAVRKIQQHLFRYQGYIGAYLIIVGVDTTGAHIATIHPHGSIAFLPFIASGSGGYTSLSVIEDRFKQDMSEDDAKKLIRDALYASTTTDLFSGSKINMFVLTKEKLEKFLPYEIVGIRGDKQADYTIPKGTTAILSESIRKINYDIVNEKVKQTKSTESMELA